MPLRKLNFAELRGESSIKWGIKEVTKPCHESLVFENGQHEVSQEWVQHTASLFVLRMQLSRWVSPVAAIKRECTKGNLPVSLQS